MGFWGTCSFWRDLQIFYCWTLLVWILFKPSYTYTFSFTLKNCPRRPYLAQHLSGGEVDINNGIETMETSSTASQLLVSMGKHLGKGEGKIRLILASQSPRRKDILNMMGLQGKFEDSPSPLDESSLQLHLLGKGDGDNSKHSGIEVVSDPKDYTRILAQEKARALAERMVAQGKGLEQPFLVLGSDTIVELEGNILEKPKSKGDAKQMLSRLSGNRHSVHTGVALFVVQQTLPEDRKIILADSFTDTATVRFASLTNADIEAYIASGEPMDKAGSYAIQGVGGQFVQSIDGDFFTVRSFFSSSTIARTR